MRELEAMADNAISRFIVLTSQRLAQRPADTSDLTRLLWAG